MSTRFEHHARNVTILTFFSRITGLARDAALSRVFGISPIMDAFWLAFLIPNLFRRLFGEGALSAAFLPVYSQLDRDDPPTARKLATLTIALMLAALGGITLVGELVLLILSMTAAPDHLAVRLMMVMLPYMPLVCTVAIFGAMLQVHGRFGPTASAPIILNAFIVAAAVGMRMLAPVPHVAIISGAVLLAGIVQVVWAVFGLRGQAWWTGIEDARSAWPHMQMVLRQAGPMFLGLGVLQVNTFIDGLIASYPSVFGPTIFGVDFPLDQGALTALNNAQRLYEFPLGVFGIAVATAIFPALARAANSRFTNDDSRLEVGVTTDDSAGDAPVLNREPSIANPDAFADILRRGLRLVVYVGLPASVGLILVRVPLTAAILQGRNFTAADTLRVAFILMGYAPAIWAYSMTHVLTRAFYARGDSMTPVRIAMIMVGLNFLLNITLIWTPLKEAGLAWSTAICAIVQVCVLLRLTRRYAADVVDRGVVASWGRSALVTIAMAAMVWLVMSVVTPTTALAGTWRWAVIQLAVLVPVGMATVWMASMVLRMPEAWWAIGRLGNEERSSSAETVR